MLLLTTARQREVKSPFCKCARRCTTVSAIMCTDRKPLSRTSAVNHLSRFQTLQEASAQARSAQRGAAHACVVRGSLAPRMAAGAAARRAWTQRRRRCIVAHVRPGIAPRDKRRVQERESQRLPAPPPSSLLHTRSQDDALVFFSSQMTSTAEVEDVNGKAEGRQAGERERGGGTRVGTFQQLVVKIKELFN